MAATSLSTERRVSNHLNGMYSGVATGNCKGDVSRKASTSPRIHLDPCSVASLRSLQAVVDTWIEIDGRLQQAQNNSQTKGHVRVAAKIGKLRTENDRAYFLLLFAHFEAYLTSRAAVLNVRRQSSPHWSTRRGWDVLNLKNMRRIAFRNRLSYCLDQTSLDYATIESLYSVRNSLAHQGTTTTPFIIPIVASDLAQIAGRLKA